MSDKTTDSDHWLVRPQTVRMLWVGAVLILVLLVAGDLIAHHRPYFGIDGTFGFAAWFGLGSCIILAVASKVVGALLKRPDDYYDH